MVSFPLFILLLLDISKVAQEHPLRAVNQAVVAEFEFTYFALIKCATSHIKALVALVSYFAI